MKGTFCARAGFGVALTAAAVLALPGSALANTVTIGSTIANAACCGPGNTYIVQSTARTSPAYTVPAGGAKITSFSIMGNANAGIMEELQVFRKTTTKGTYKVVGQSVPETLAASTLNTFAVSIPVRQGDTLGVTRTDTGTALAPIFSTQAAFAPADILNAAPGNPATGSTFAFPAANHSPGRYRLNVSAVVLLRPIVTSISPTTGPSNTPVTITGQNFTGATTVVFGTKKAVVHVVSDTQATAPAPPMAAGTKVDVRVCSASGCSLITPADKFTYS